MNRKVLRFLLLAAVFAGAGSLASGETGTDLPALNTIEHDVLFRVERDGVVTGFFTEVSGLGSENEVEEFRDGTTGIVRKVPGRLKWPNIVLKRGITGDMRAWAWRQEVVDGDVPRSQVRITMFRRTGGVVAAWQVFNAWPSMIMAYSRENNGDIVIEELTLTHEGMERVMSSP